MVSRVGKRVRPTMVTREHIRPLARGGTNDLSNIAIACHHCNRTRGGDESALDWVPFHSRAYGPQAAWRRHGSPYPIDQPSQGSGDGSGSGGEGRK